jgi:hypothetical protein
MIWMISSEREWAGEWAGASRYVRDSLRQEWGPPSLQEVVGDVDPGDVVIKGNSGICECTRHWCATDELGQLWNLWCAEGAIIEKGYPQPVELRGIDVGYKVLQIFADPSEIKRCEDREDRACRERETPAFQIRERFTGFESEEKIFKAGQRGKGGGHRVG